MVKINIKYKVTKIKIIKKQKHLKISNLNLIKYIKNKTVNLDPFNIHTNKQIKFINRNLKFFVSSRNKSILNFYIDEWDLFNWNFNNIIN